MLFWMSMLLRIIEFVVMAFVIPLALLKRQNRKQRLIRLIFGFGVIFFLLGGGRSFAYLLFWVVGWGFYYYHPWTRRHEQEFFVEKNQHGNKWYILLFMCKGDVSEWEGVIEPPVIHGKMMDRNKLVQWLKTQPEFQIALAISKKYTIIEEYVSSYKKLDPQNYEQLLMPENWKFTFERDLGKLSQVIFETNIDPLALNVLIDILEFRFSEESFIMGTKLGEKFPAEDECQPKDFPKELIRMYLIEYLDSPYGRIILAGVIHNLSNFDAFNENGGEKLNQISLEEKYNYIVDTIDQIKEEDFKKSGINEIDTMDGWEFEKRMEIYFQTMGWEVTQTKTSHDYGADLILLSPSNRKIVIQLKRWNTPVGIKAVQEVIGSQHYYNADGAMVITNSNFTDNAKGLAKKANVDLWDREELIRQLLYAEEELLNH